MPWPRELVEPFREGQRSGSRQPTTRGVGKLDVADPSGMRRDSVLDVVFVDAEVVDVEEQTDVGGKDIGAGVEDLDDVVGRPQRIVRDTTDRFQHHGAFRRQRYFRSNIRRHRCFLLEI